MRTLLSRWTFHKAGQGCFYTGIIDAHGRDKFCFVFDCGSTQGAAILREEIKDFKSSLFDSGKSEIDLLVLSHYDADHVNQLPALLKNLRCKIAVLPYLSNSERLQVYFRQSFADGTDDDDYFRFIVDPAGYLSYLNVERIIFIDGNDEQTEAGINFGGPSGGGGQDPREHDNETRQGRSDVSLSAEVDFKFSGSEGDPEKIQLVKSTGTKVEFAKGNGRIRSGLYWEFYFHQKRQPPEAVRHFREKLREVFTLDLTGDYITHEELQVMTGNAKARSKLKKNHMQFFGDINETGLMVVHGPLRQRHTASFRKKRVLYEGRYSSTLLNGDCNLRHAEYPRYIMSALPCARFFQVPHHGSSYSWYRLDELDDMRPTQMIVNYGTDNKHKHPHKSVVSIIEFNYPFWQLKRNTEKKKYSYRITSYI